MKTVSVESLRAACRESCARTSDERIHIPRGRERRPIYRPLWRGDRRILPRAIAWHIERGLFSPCAY
jgi:hypothetical protein